MLTYIALLRGINVGGHKKVLMAELRVLLTKSGLENVKTYIQSGNVIFQSSEKDKSKLENKIHRAIKAKFGFEVPILVRTSEDLKVIFDNYPFLEEKKVNSYFTILSEMPEKDLVAEASQKVYPDEAYVILNGCIYFYCANGCGNTKINLNFFENKMKVNATSRNYKTIVKLLSLCKN